MMNFVFVLNRLSKYLNLGVDFFFLVMAFCWKCSTPDYITPDNQNLLNSFDCNKVMKMKVWISWLGYIFMISFWIEVITCFRRKTFLAPSHRRSWILWKVRGVGQVRLVVALIFIYLFWLNVFRGGNTLNCFYFLKIVIISWVA